MLERCLNPCLSELSQWGSLLGHLRTTFKDTVIPLEGTEGAKMSSSAMELKGFGGMHGAWAN